MENEIYNPEDELTHWGVRGMRWGVRRYQNKDGTLTPAGRKRYNAELAKVRKEEVVIKNRQAVKARMERLEARKKAVSDKKKELDDDDVSVQTSTKTGKKSVKDMTDAELRDAVNRAQLENQYRQLHPEPAPKQSFAKQFLDGAVKPGLVNAGRNAIESVLKKSVESVLKDKVDPNSVEALKKTYEKLDYQTKIDKLRNPDKYLSEEDKTKRADREYKAEDRAAQKEGYKDATDKAAHQRAEANRKANEERSRQEYEKTASATYAKRYPNSQNTTSDTVDTGKSTVAGLLTSSKNTSVLALPAPTVDRGRQAAVEVLDTSGNVVASFDSNNNPID